MFTKTYIRVVISRKALYRYNMNENVSILIAVIVYNRRVLDVELEIYTETFLGQLEPQNISLFYCEIRTHVYRK